MKKADLSIQVIVVAAISLVVLIILVVIFAGQARNGTNNLNNCENKGGNCNTAASAPCPDGSFQMIGLSCAKDKKCCINTGG
jgi:hypothetical protein